MSRKVRVAIIFGGRSAEHEVSLQSAKNIIEAIDRDRFEPVLIGIDRGGKWHLDEASNLLLQAENPRLIRLNQAGTEVALVQHGASNQLISSGTREPLGSIDVAFPVLHGPCGEDGSIQGLFKLAGVPYVGADILGSAVGMDKDVMKRLLRDAGIATAGFRVLTRNAARRPSFDELAAELGRPMFIKPANMGSSVGVFKVQDEEQLRQALAAAFEYDRKVLAEEYIRGREIECAVLGNHEPRASVPGEVIVQREFYSYEAKYVDEHGAILEIPARLSPELTAGIQALAVRSFNVLCCAGMARVDFFLKEDGAIYVNEINTLPGFTCISMYPKLWQASGLSYTALISRLIELAVERYEEERGVKTSVGPG
jgi:D-alanine-D-alanine ligase